MTVVWTGGWWEPQKEADAVTAFADQGIDVIAEQVDSPITIAETAQKTGTMVVGKDVDISDRAGDVWLTGVSWNWGPMMAEQVQAIHDGTWTPGHLRGDLQSGHAVLDPFGPKVPQEVIDEVLAAKEKILSGALDIWSGPIVNQAGETIVPEGEVMEMETIESMGFMVQGVTGSTS